MSLDDIDKQGPEVNLRIPALIPEAYIFDINSRLSMYKRIASVKNSADMRELQVEMIDRFGLLPDQVKNLCQQTVLRISLETFGIDRVDMNNRFGTIDFGRKTVVDPIKIVQLVQAEPHRYTLAKGTQLKFTIETETADQRFATIEQILAKITQ
ncbi:MAG: transcription-repair coupling factor (superfamily II helicase) [Reinekea sp.]